MHRYQCHDCERLHDRDKEPKCSIHGHGYSGRCSECVHLYQQRPCRGGGQS
jgi:hypothetical protein